MSTRFRTRAASAWLLALAAIATFGGCAATRDQRTGYLQLIHPDQRPPMVMAREATDSLFGAIEESDHGDGIARSRRPELESMVRRFAPTLVLPRGDEVSRAGRKFQLIPTDPRLFDDTLHIDEIAASPYRFSRSVAVDLRSASPDSLARLLESAVEYRSPIDELKVWYFDFPGRNPREWWETYAGIRSGPDGAAWETPTVIAHPSLEAEGRVVIQYWYFYPFNDYLGNHEGDWEHVNVVIAPSGDSVEEVHYFFHNRSVRLPSGHYAPEIVDGTHPVVYVGGRANAILNGPMRRLTGDRNSGSHGNYPYAGEWEAAAGLGFTESVSKADAESTRVLDHGDFNVVLTPEPSRIDYRKNPEVLREWLWLLLPARWGFPSAPSIGSAMRMADVGNHAPFGPAFNSGWNRPAPGIGYSSFTVRRVPRIQSYVEDLVQPWYYLYAFRYPRLVNDSRGLLERHELERLGLGPRSGWAERGIGSPILGASIAFPHGRFGGDYRNSAGFLLWRNFWVKARAGGLEMMAGYQRFRSEERGAGTFFVYPFTLQAVVHGPEGRIRPYASVGIGAYGWESRQRVPNTNYRILESGWGFGENIAAGFEYYLRPKLALDISLRFHDAAGPPETPGSEEHRLRFMTLWVGHYLRL